MNEANATIGVAYVVIVPSKCNTSYPDDPYAPEPTTWLVEVNTKSPGMSSAALFPVHLTFIFVHNLGDGGTTRHAHGAGSSKNLYVIESMTLV